MGKEKGPARFSAYGVVTISPSSDYLGDPVAHDPELPFALTADHTSCLTEMLCAPKMSTLRLVEHLSFLQSGGNQWTRDLQIKIPETSVPRERVPRIVSLGSYARQRFADFSVINARGERLSLVTRHQHGITLTQGTITKLLREIVTGSGAIEADAALYGLWQTLYAFFTTSGKFTSRERIELPEKLARQYEAVLSGLNVPPAASDEYVEKFTNEIVELLDITRYLCWVEASPGEMFDLRVAYTTSDQRRKLGRGTIPSRLATLWAGLSEPRERRWGIWAEWYRQFGLAPLNYEFSVPSSRHVGSYYFTVEPPLGTDVTYLDWEVGDSLENGEIDCSRFAAHVHNAHTNESKRFEETASRRGGTIRAYLHCSPQDHKLIVGTAILNCVFAFLVAAGRVHGQIGSPAQGVLLAAPSIYIAFMARQQRHYFADAMRRQRGILWWYLGFSAAFLVTLAFGKHNGTIGSRGFGTFSSIIVWLWGGGSALVAAWFLPLGGSYERITESLGRKRLDKVRDVERTWTCPAPKTHWLARVCRFFPVVRAIRARYLSHKYDIAPSWKCYQRAIRLYSSQITIFMTVVSVGTLTGLGLFWLLR